MIWELLFYDSDWLSRYEPQAKAGKLAQLGGEGLLRGIEILEEQANAVRHAKNKKLPENCNLRVCDNNFGEHNHRRTAHRQRTK